MKTLKLVSLFLIVGLSVSNCGKQEEDEDTKKVGASISPGTGVVIASDYTYVSYYPPATTDNPNPLPVTETVTGPWYLATFNLVNSNPNYNVYVMGIKVLSYGTRSGETSPVSSVTEIEPGDMSVNQNSDQTDDQDFILALAPGQSGSSSWFIGGLPELRKAIEAGDTTFDNTKVKYSVLVEISGFFAPTGTISGNIDYGSQPAVKAFIKNLRWEAEL